MSPAPHAFFTVDRGVASTAASLIARLDGRWRLLAAVSVPASVPLETVLGRLADDVAAADADILPGAGAWRDWARVESRTGPARRVLVAGPSERVAGPVARAFADDGWAPTAIVTPERHDALGAAVALHDPDLELIVLAAPEPLGGGDREGLVDLAALIGVVAARRDDLRVVVVGAAGSVRGLPEERVRRVAGPAEGLAAGRELVPRPCEGREGFVRSIASIASITDLRVEGVDVGMDAGTRVMADRDGIVRTLTSAEAGLMPEPALEDQRLLDAIAWWSPIAEDAYVTRDRLRNLRVAPWRDAGADGTRLRLAAVRAALHRLEEGWAGTQHERRVLGGRLRERGHGPVPATAPDLLVASGGAFAIAPPPAVALALIDTLRAPGAVALAFDHARVLAPLGVLEDEHDRRRLLADLMDDVLVPLGSSITAPGLRATHRGTIHVTVGGATTSLSLASGTVQVVDLAPGLTASVRLESPDELWIGTRTRSVAFDVSGGLGGLLVDTREIPLRLPERAERRREVLESWQQPLWTGGES